MNEEIKNILEDYIKLHVMPILLQTSKTSFKDYVEIPANCPNEYLKETYDINGYKKPIWYNKIISKANAKLNLLIITDIDKVDKEKQRRFVELLKYRQISSLHLPKNCVIIVLADNINKESIDQEVYSLLAHIN